MAMPASPPPEGEDKSAWAGDPVRRRSIRLLLSVPIVVRWRTSEGEDFAVEARTLVVNAHGALISLGAQLDVGQLITVENKSTAHAIECRVVYSGTGQGGRIQMGIEFLKASQSFWQVEFPPSDWVVPET
jgi:hypothetical protein